MGDKSPTLFYKKNSLPSDLLPTCKIFMTRPVLGKKDQGTFVARLGNFYHYLLEIKVQEIFRKKIKVALPEHCVIKIVAHFFW